MIRVVDQPPSDRICTELWDGWYHPFRNGAGFRSGLWAMVTRFCTDLRLQTSWARLQELGNGSPGFPISGHLDEDTYHQATPLGCTALMAQDILTLLAHVADRVDDLSHRCYRLEQSLLAMNEHGGQFGLLTLMTARRLAGVDEHGRSHRREQSFRAAMQSRRETGFVPDFEGEAGAPGEYQFADGTRRHFPDRRSEERFNRTALENAWFGTVRHWRNVDPSWQHGAPQDRAAGASEDTLGARLNTRVNDVEAELGGLTAWLWRDWRQRGW